MKKIILLVALIALGLISTGAAFALEWGWLIKDDMYKIEFKEWKLNEPASLSKNGNVMMNLKYIGGGVKEDKPQVFNGTLFFEDSEGRIYSLIVVNSLTSFVRNF